MSSDGPNMTTPARNAFIGRGSADSRSMRLGFFGFLAFTGSGFFGLRR